MAEDAGNVGAGLHIKAYVAPEGTTGPTTSVAALNVAFTDFGWISQEGLVETPDDETSDIRGSDGTLLRRLITGSSWNFELTFLENKTEVVELYHKGSTMASDGGTGYKMDILTPTRDVRSFVFEVTDGDMHYRIYVPTAEVTERQGITYANGEPIAYHVTVSAYPDATGKWGTKFSDSAAWA